MGVRPGETMDEVLVGSGERLGEEMWSGVAEIAPSPAADDGTSPPSDTNASADYRRQLARVLTRRALEEALSR